MAKDFQLAWACPHLTVEEVVSLGSDYRSLDTRQPVAGSGTVRILVNDELYVPQGGLLIPAQLFGSISGPFDLVENEDTLTVETPAGTATVTFGIRGATRWTADQVLKELQRQRFSVALGENISGHLSFTDSTTVGLDSFAKVSGTAAVALGFGTPEGIGNGQGTNYQWKVTGKQLYPGWELHTRPDEITNRFPKFKEPIRNNPLFKVTYTVPPQRCLRCGGSYVENDFRYDSSGQHVLIANEDLLYQAALKILLTDRGSNPYHPWYGTLLKSRIGSKALSGVATLINEDVRRALGRFQTLQEEQAKYQTVTFQERLYSVLAVEVLPHAQDPTTYMINVWVQNASSKPVQLSIVFTVPGVVATMGSNGLMLGNEIAGLSTTGALDIPNSPLRLTDGS